MTDIWSQQLSNAMSACNHTQTPLHDAVMTGLQEISAGLQDVHVGQLAASASAFGLNDVPCPLIHRNSQPSHAAGQS